MKMIVSARKLRYDEKRRGERMINQSIQAIQEAPLVLKILMLLLAILLAYLLLSVCFAPMMYLYNKITDRNQSNVAEERTYYLGEVTLKIQGKGYGEVLDTEHQSLYPARLFQLDEQQAEVLYPVGTKVLIIEFDREGVARVAKANSFLERGN